MTKYSSEFLRHIQNAVDSTTTPARIHQFLHDRWMEGHDNWLENLTLECKQGTKGLGGDAFQVFYLTAHENGKPTGPVAITTDQIITRDCHNPRCIHHRLGMWMLCEKMQPQGPTHIMHPDFSGVRVGSRFVGMMLCNAVFNTMEDFGTKVSNKDYEMCAKYDTAKIPASAFTFDRNGLTFRDPEYMQGCETHGKPKSLFEYPFALTVTDGWLHVMLPKADPRWLQWPPVQIEPMPKFILSLEGGWIGVASGESIPALATYTIQHAEFHINLQGGWAHKPLHEPTSFCLHELHLDSARWSVPAFKLTDKGLDYQYRSDALPATIPYPLSLTITLNGDERVLRVFIPEDDPRINHLTDKERAEYDMAKRATEHIQAREAEEEDNHSLNEGSNLRKEINAEKEGQ